MSMDKWHDAIASLQQQMETVRAASTVPRQWPAALQDTIEVLQTSLEELQVAYEELRQHQMAVAVAQQASEAASQRYQTLFDFAPDGYLVTDPLGIIQEANRAAAALLAMPQAWLVGMPFALFVPPEGQQSFRTQLAALARVPRLQDWEVRLQPQDGQPFVAALSVAALPSLEGQHTRLLWLLRDMTNHKQAEAALHDSEARQRAIVQTAACGIITIDECGRIESFNPAAERLFGYTADEVIGQNVSLLMPSPYREAHDSYIARYLQTREPHIIGIGREVRAQRRDGTTFPIALAVSEVHLDGRRLFTGIVHDLTARVQAEEALAQLNQRHQLILDSAGEGIYGIDLEGRITFVNPAAARLLGWEVEELLGQPMHDLVCHTRRDGTPCSPDAGPIRASCRDGIVQHVLEDIFWRKDGTSFLVEYVSTPMREHDTLVGAVVVFKDITERERIEQEMQRADRLALVGQLASGLAHEIGTPLNIIAGNAELLGMELRDRSLDTAAVDAIVQHADRITGLIQQLLAFARAKEQSMAVLAVQAPLAKVLRLLETRFTHQGITVIMEVPSVLPLIRGRAEQLEQVFLNVLVNAWHAMPDGGTLTMTAAGTSHRTVRLRFVDTGVGMAAEVLARACEPFYSTKGERGTGLGLAICQQIIDSHQGRMWLESTPGVGTTVTIELPQADITDLPRGSLSS
jgi:PAS domain S-box-containing protein